MKLNFSFFFHSLMPSDQHCRRAIVVNDVHCLMVYKYLQSLITRGSCEIVRTFLFHTKFFFLFLQKIILRNGSEMFEYWTSPPIDPIVKVYVFNYSNIFEVESGVDKRIRLDEVGPYVYRERTVKTGLKLEGDKITFNVSESLLKYLEFWTKFEFILGQSISHLPAAFVWRESK